MCQEVQTTFSCGHTLAIILPCAANLASQGQAPCSPPSPSPSEASSSATRRPSQSRTSSSSSAHTQLASAAGLAFDINDNDDEGDEDDAEEQDEDLLESRSQYKRPTHETVEGPCFACLTASDPALQRREALRKQRAANRDTPARYYKQAIRFEKCGHSTLPIPTDIEIEEDDNGGVDLSALGLDDENGMNTGTDAGDMTAGRRRTGQEDGRGNRGSSKDDDTGYVFFEYVEGYCLDCRSQGIGAGKEDVGRSMRPSIRREPLSLMRGLGGGRGAGGGSIRPRAGKGRGKATADARAGKGVLSLDAIGEGDFETSEGEDDDEEVGVPNWKAP